MNTSRAAHFLAQGLGHSQVAALMGCTPARITQLSSSFEFQTAIEEAREKLSETPEVAEEDLLSAKYSVVEHNLLKQLGDSVSFMEPRDMLRALEVVSRRQEEMKKRLAMRAMPQQAQGATITVSLTIPQHAVPEYTMNQQGEIVSIDSKPMAALSSTGVKNLFASLRGLTQPELALNP